MDTARILLLAAFCGLRFWPALAQTPDARWLGSLHGLGLDYQGPVQGTYFEPSSFGYGPMLGVHAYAARWLNVSAQAGVVPAARVPVSDSATDAAFWIEGALLLRLKSNGTLTRPDFPVGLSLVGGVGYNAADTLRNVCAPLGAALNVRIGRSLWIQWESLYRIPLRAGAYQPLTHSLGLLFAAGGKAAKVPPKKSPAPPAPPPPTAQAAPDRDADGIADTADRCPEAAGLMQYGGCPDSAARAAAQTAAPTSNAPGPAPAAGPPATGKTDNASVGTAQYEAETADPLAMGPKRLNSQRKLPEAEAALLAEVAAKIGFAPGSDKLNPVYHPDLDRVAAVLGQYPDAKLHVAGHVARTADDDADLVLSIKRAYSVKYYLVYQAKIPQRRISSDGYGGDRPIDTGTTPEAEARNNRVEFEVYLE